MIDRRQFVGGGVAIAAWPTLARASEGLVIPFAFYRDMHPVVPVMLDGKGPYPFLITTGAAYDVIDDDLADELGLKPVNALSNALLGRTMVTRGEVKPTRQVACDAVVVGDAYAIGHCTFEVEHHGDATAADRALRAAHRLLPNFPRGVLGTRFVVYKPTVFDNDLNMLRVYPDGLEGVDDYTDLEARFRGLDSNDDIVIEVPAMLDGESLPCWIDLNGAAELYLASKYVRHRDLWDSFATFSDMPADRVDPSKGILRVARARNFSLGPMRFDEVNVIMGDPRQNDHLNEAGIKAVIGRGLLQQANLAFERGRLLVKANRRFTPVSGPYVREPL